MKSVSTQVFSEIRQSFWDPQGLHNKPLWLRMAIPVFRIIYAIWRDWWSGELTLRAMSLVYTTLLSLVPLLAVSFSMLKAFGVRNQMEALLSQALQPLGEQGIVISTKIISFVDNMKVGVLGTLGLVMLFYTIIALMQKIEAAFNYTWHVSQNRRMGQRFSYYLSAIMTGPVLVFAAIGLSATLMDSSVVQQLLSIEPLGSIIAFLAKFIPTLMIIVAFMFFYVLIPNTEVNIRSALIGAIVAGLLWQGVGYLFASLVVGSAKYTAIYSALATLIFFMVWLYVGWMILLIGASIAYYHQHPERLLHKNCQTQLSFYQQRIMSWLILVEIQRYFAKGLSGPSAATIAANLSESAESVDRVMAKLQDLGLVIFIAADEGWKPAQDLGKITLSQIQFKLAQWGEHQQLIINQKTMPRSILYWETRLEELSLHQLPAITIAQVVDEETEAGDLAGNN